eukprot:scaffold1033_cov171-Amphora_coffeaeformis.AAC.24
MNLFTILFGNFRTIGSPSIRTQNHTALEHHTTNGSTRLLGRRHFGICYARGHLLNHPVPVDIVKSKSTKGTVIGTWHITLGQFRHDCYLVMTDRKEKEERIKKRGDSINNKRYFRQLPRWCVLVLFWLLCCGTAPRISPLQYHRRASAGIFVGVTFVNRKGNQDCELFPTLHVFFHPARRARDDGPTANVQKKKFINSNVVKNLVNGVALVAVERT